MFGAVGCPHYIVESEIDPWYHRGIRSAPVTMVVTSGAFGVRGEEEVGDMSARRQGLRLVSFTMVLLVLGLAATTSADTIYVCWDGSGDYLTIQEGIDAAVDGDEVVVCDGTYTGDGNRDLDFHGKAITVRSENGPDNCIIDCQGSEVDPHRGFYFHSGETPAAMVQGLTIRNGYVHQETPGRYGGGVYCSSASPTINNCTITGNTGEWYGGGIYCWGSGNPTITDCTITNNTAQDGSGVCCRDSDATITNCTIQENFGAYSWAIYLSGGSPLVSNCTIQENAAGGIDLNDVSAVVTNCTIIRNEWYGLNANTDETEMVITSCTIAENWAGIQASGSGLTIERCIVEDNSAIGVYLSGGSTMADCTIAGNGSGGVSCGSGATVANCVIEGNTGSGIHCSGYGGGEAAHISNCRISGNSSDSGAGIRCYSNAAPWIVNCVIAGNYATDVYSGMGGGVSCVEESDARLINCLIVDNLAVNDGGAIHCDGSSPAVINCTISGNFAVFFGGGVACDLGSVPTIRNSVLWDDTAGLGGELAVLNGSVLRVAYSDVEGGQAAVFVDDDSLLLWGYGNVEADPFFADPASEDYRLSGGSPCIDAGDNFSVLSDVTDLDGDGDTTEPTPLDLDGHARFVGDPATEDTGLGDPPIVDMGAYEYQGTSCTGDLDGDGDTDHSDLGVLLADWGCVGSGPEDCPGDLDGDFDTDHSDLGILLADWGCGI